MVLLALQMSDLKALLLEAKQKVIPFLDQMGLLSHELLELGGHRSVGPWIGNGTFSCSSI